MVHSLWTRTTFTATVPMPDSNRLPRVMCPGLTNSLENALVLPRGFEPRTFPTPRGCTAGSVLQEHGASHGTRTHGLVLTKDVLCRLS